MNRISYFILFLSITFISCSINKSDLEKFASEKNSEKLNLFIEDNLKEINNIQDKESINSKWGLLDFSLDLIAGNKIDKSLDYLEQLYFKDPESRISKDILMAFNKYNLHFKDMNKLADIFIKSHILNNKNTELESLQEKMLANYNDKHYSNLLRKCLNNSISNDKWNVANHCCAHYMNFDTTGNVKSLNLKLSRIVFINQCENDKDFDKLSLTIKNMDKQIDELLSLSGSYVSDESDANRDLEDKKTSVEDIYARVYEMKEKMFNVRAWLSGALGDNSYEVTFSNGKGVLVMTEHTYTTTGFVNVWTTVEGRQEVTLKNGGIAYWTKYVEIDKATMASYYEDLRIINLIERIIAKDRALIRKYQNLHADLDSKINNVERQKESQIKIFTQEKNKLINEIKKQST